MGRPKAPRRGKTITIYLRPDRLDRLGPKPSITIYRLIDSHEATLPGAQAAPAPRKPGHTSVSTPTSRWICKCGQKNFASSCSRCKENQP